MALAFFWQVVAAAFARRDMVAAGVPHSRCRLSHFVQADRCDAAVIHPLHGLSGCICIWRALHQHLGVVHPPSTHMAFL
jgi:hypothetical protein